MGILTKDQRKQWKTEGYIVLKEVLSSEEVHALKTTVDEMDAEFRKGENVTADSVFDKRNVMEDNDIFVDLMDHPVTFPIVRELIGDFIQLSMSEVIVRPPNPKDQGYLHTDGGQAMRTIRVSRSSSPLQVKIHYFLTDLEHPDSGNFTIVPGSHNRTFPETGVKEGPYIPEAVQLCVKAGDAAVFPHALWHGVVANRSEQPRKTLIYCYSHQCFRPFDYEKATPELMERCTPRQRRLIGDIGDWKPGSYFYSPGDQEKIIDGLAEEED